MEENLLAEWRKFSLTEAEAPGFVVEDDAMGISKALGSNCLLGRLITDKYFNKEAMKSSMLRLWGLARGITVQDIGENLFVFQFSNEYERTRVLNGSPWLFDNYLLALNEFDGSCPATQIQFNHCWFWVQLHGVPLYYMTKLTGERVGGALGDVAEVDVPANGVGWGPFLRIRVSIDITKPIPRGRLVTFHSLGQMWVSFKYERLPWLCFHCGIIGHLERECVLRLREDKKNEDTMKQYGPWLRAAEFVQRRRAPGTEGDRMTSLFRRRSVARRSDDLNLERNRHADISDSNNSCASSRPTQKNEDSVSAHPKSSQRMDMHVEQVGKEDLFHAEKAPQVFHSVKEMRIPKESIGVEPTEDNGAKVSGLSLNRGSMRSDDGVNIAHPEPLSSRFPAVKKNISAKVSAHAAQGVSYVNHSTPNELPHVIFSAKEGPHKGKKSGKLSWKRLAREKGKTSATTVECSKRRVDVCGGTLLVPETKRFKKIDDSQVSENSVSAEAANQPRRDQ